MALLTFEQVTVGYDGTPVLSDVSFSVNAGEYLCIVGENGSGKSSLMKAMLGLIRPYAGHITMGDGLRQNEIGYLPQQTETQRDFPASVMEVVLSGTLNRPGFHPFYSKADKQLAAQNLKLLDLEPFATHCYHDLSGGQQQRVLLARALCATKKLLLLDEPVSGLDPLVTTELYRIIHELNRSHGLTVIMVTHDISAAVSEATHILHLYHKPLFFGKTEDYLASDLAKSFFRRHDL
ncbi:MAG: metal ABC transporter ATP-binding protein [Oscillospiraceae bacterium]|jgi:zinc transport system ATP-binding protein